MAYIGNDARSKLTIPINAYQELKLIAYSHTITPNHLEIPFNAYQELKHSVAHEKELINDLEIPFNAYQELKLLVFRFCLHSDNSLSKFLLMPIRN